MSKIYNDVTELMGKTPLVHFKRIEEKYIRFNIAIK